MSESASASTPTPAAPAPGHVTTIPEQQAKLMRTVLPLQLVPLGVFLGAALALVMTLSRGTAGGSGPDSGASIPIAPLVVLALAYLAWVIGSVVLLSASRTLEAQLQDRLATAGSLPTADWHQAPAVLARAPRAKKNSPFRTAMYVARTGEQQTLPVAVRLAPENPPAPGSGARLLLHPSDPAVAVLDPTASAADHATAAAHPAFTGLSREQLGLSFGFRKLLPWLAGAAIAACLPCVALLAIS